MKRKAYIFNALLLAALSVALLFALLPGCTGGTPVLLTRLTLDDVAELSGRGLTLSWADFEGFAHQAEQTTAGSVLWEFAMAEPGFSLTIYGASTDEPPADILLRSQAGNTVEVRTGDVSAFIAQESAEQPQQPTPPPTQPAPPQPPPNQPEPPAPHPTFSVAANPSSYDLSASSITVTITNTSQVEGDFGLSYRIERNVNGRWESIPLNIAVPSIAVILSPGQSTTETFSLHQDQFAYQPGTYRIVLLDLGGLTAQFTLTGGSPTYSVAVQPSALPVSAEYITVRITNTSQVESGYGLNYRIEKLVNGSWEAVQLDFAVASIFNMLPAGQTNTETFSLHRDQFDYQPGTYRIVFLDGLGGASAQFTLS